MSCIVQNIKLQLLLGLSPAVTLKNFDICYFVHPEYLRFLDLSYAALVISLGLIKRFFFFF